MNKISGNERKLFIKIKYMLKERTIGGILMVVLGNIALLFSKVLSWLIVPKILGVTEYGYYKIFTLYLVYGMLLHFGFPDGILLIYGGQDYRKINRYEFRLYSKFFIIFQLTISTVIIGISLLLCRGMQCYIFCMIGIDSLFVNLATYYKFVSQAVMQFKEYTIRNIIQALLQILALCIIVVLAELEILPPNGAIYIFSIVLIDAILLVWYVKTYKDITFGKATTFKNQAPKIKEIFSVGIFLTIAFQVAHLVFVLDSQMVEILFDLETYSLYAFAYSIANMITAIISAVATVMFPSLKRLEVQEAVSKFSTLMAIISVTVFFLLEMYFPLTLFVKWFLPDYATALDYLKVIMPGLAVSCCINMIIFTYYKVLNQLRRYLYISISMLIIGGILNGIGYLIAQSPIAFSVASVLTLLIWYLWSERYLVKQFHAKWKMNFVYILVEMLIFYTVNLAINSIWLCMFLYFTGYILTTGFLYRNQINDWKNKYMK